MIGSVTHFTAILLCDFEQIGSYLYASVTSPHCGAADPFAHPLHVFSKYFPAGTPLP